MTNLIQAEVDGQRLTNAEISAFLVLLSVAGNDTTRQTTSLTMHALTQFPEQRAWLMADYENRIGTTVDEFVRWSTPVMTFSRIDARDYVLRGQPIAAGDKAVMIYSSGQSLLGGLRPPRTLRPEPQPQLPCRIRRWRCPLLSGCPVGQGALFT